MRLTIGSYILDSTQSSSTTTTAALRLDPDEPAIQIVTGNTQARWTGFRVYVSDTSEANIKSAIDAVTAQLAAIDGKTITYYNTTGTALAELTAGIWTHVEADYRVDYELRRIDFDIVATRESAPATGSGDETGQRGDIEWEFEIGPNGLQAATATAEFGPTTGSAAIVNARTWVASFYTNPPTEIPTFITTRLRPVSSVVRAPRMPNQTSVTDSSYSPVTVSVFFRETYSGPATWPSLVTDLNVNVSMVNSEAMDVRSGETEGPALVTLSGYFIIISEDPTDFLTSATKVGRDALYQKAIDVFALIESDFLTVHNRFTMNVLGDAVLDLGLDSGRVSFSRTYSTTQVLRWLENTRVQNVEPVVINRDHAGRDVVHWGNGGPVVTLMHDLHIETLGTPKEYRAPSLNSDWIRVDATQDVTVSSRLRGDTIIHTTRGASTWRYVNRGARGPSDRQTASQGKVLTLSNLGNGTL